MRDRENKTLQKIKQRNKKRMYIIQSIVRKYCIIQST